MILPRFERRDGVTLVSLDGEFCRVRSTAAILDEII